MAVFDACRHGSTRKKATAFLTNEDEPLALSDPCAECSSHAKWGRKPDFKFSTADEAAYPGFCVNASLRTSTELLKVSCLIPHHARSKSSSPNAAAWAEVSAPHFGVRVHREVHGSKQPPLDAKNCFTCEWLRVPLGFRGSVDGGEDKSLSPRPSPVVFTDSTKALSTKLLCSGILSTPLESCRMECCSVKPCLKNRLK